MLDQTSFSAAVYARLPLAQAVLELGRHLWDPDFLDEFYARHAGASYEKVVTFPDFLALIRDALLHHDGSLNAACDHAAEAGVLPVSRPALYGKLRRVPESLSESLVRELTARLQPIRVGPAAFPLPASLAGLDVVMVDGKKLKRVAKRLRATRGAAGQVFGGKLLACWCPRTGLLTAMAAEADGEANDCRLVEPLLAQPGVHVRDRPRLWVADRQFGDLTQPARFAADGHYFLVRRNARTQFHPDSAVPPQSGQDAEGRTFVERWGWLGQGPHRLYVREVMLNRPTDPVVVVTNLLDATAVPGVDLLAVYRKRWGIEQVFQQVTEVFGLTRFIGSSARATVFQAAVCVLLYNLIQVVAGYVAEAGGRPLEQVSSEKVFGDVQKELIGLHRLVDEADLPALVEPPVAAAELPQRLRTILQGCWRNRYIKAVNRTARPHRPRPKQSGAHTSVHRLVQQEKERRRNKPD
jgi:hypothetical protein